MAVSAFSNKHRHMISTVILILIQTIIFYLRFKRFPVLFPGSVPVLESISPKRFSVRTRTMHIQGRYHSGQAILFSRYMKCFLETSSYNERKMAYFTGCFLIFFDFFYFFSASACFFMTESALCSISQTLCCLIPR